MLMMLFIIVAAAVSAYQVYSWLKSGIVWGRREKPILTRKENPIRFWFGVGSMTLVFVCCLAYLKIVVIDGHTRWP
jgi:hypothetical protein